MNDFYSIEKWKTMESNYLYRHKYLTVRKDTVVTQAGAVITDFFVIENPDWVNVIAITDQGLFVIEEQYRHGIDKVGYEICAGMIEKGESPLEAAKRELREETGYGEGEWELFMQSTPNPSSMNNVNYTYLAKGVVKLGEPALEQTESIRVSLLTKDDVLRLLETDSISEGIMQAPLWKYFAISNNILNNH